jgi:RNA polymerase sigma factor (sigma-70 family)
MTGTDAELLDRYVAERADDAFGELVRRHIDGVYSSALRRVGGNCQLAEDVTQVVFTSLAQNALRLRGHPALAAWLYVTTRNHAANAVRGEIRRRNREREAHAMIEDSTDRTESADWSRVGPVLDSAIDQLGEEDRSAIVLRFVDKRTFADIGAALHVSEDAARMRVERALERLRGVLKRRGISSTSAALGIAMAEHAAVAAPAGLTAAVTTAALAVGPATLGTLAGILGFMSTTKALVGAATVAAAVAIGTATYEVRSARRIEAAVSAADSENAAMAQKLHAAVQAAAAAETAARTAARQEQPDTPKATAPGQNSDSEAQRKAIAAGTAFMQRHPEVLKLVTDTQRSLAQERFGWWLQRSGCTPAQIEQFYAFIMGDSLAWQGELSDGTRLALKLPLPGATAEDVVVQLAASVGKSVPDLVREMRGIMLGNALARQLAAKVYLTAEPLTVQQAHELAAISAAAYPSNARPDDFASVDLTDFYSSAAAVLTPMQLSALKGMETQRVYQTALRQATQAASSGAATQTKTAN